MKKNKLCFGICASLTTAFATFALGLSYLFFPKCSLLLACSSFDPVLIFESFRCVYQTWEEREENATRPFETFLRYSFCSQNGQREILEKKEENVNDFSSETFVTNTRQALILDEVRFFCSSCRNRNNRFFSGLSSQKQNYSNLNHIPTWMSQKEFNFPKFFFLLDLVVPGPVPENSKDKNQWKDEALDFLLLQEWQNIVNDKNQSQENQDFLKLLRTLSQTTKEWKRVVSLVYSPQTSTSFVLWTENLLYDWDRFYSFSLGSKKVFTKKFEVNSNHKSLKSPVDNIRASLPNLEENQNLLKLAVKNLFCCCFDSLYFFYFFFIQDPALANQVFLREWEMFFLQCEK